MVKNLIKEYKIPSSTLVPRHSTPCQKNLHYHILSYNSRYMIIAHTTNTNKQIGVN